MVDLGSIAFGAFGTALISLIAGFVGAGIASRREHRKWVREEQLRAYVAFYQLAGRYDAAGGYGDWGREINDAYLRLQLVGSDVVSVAARRYDDAVRATNVEIAKMKDQDNDEAVDEATDKQNEAMEAFMKAARKDLGLRG